MKIFRYGIKAFCLIFVFLLSCTVNTYAAEPWEGTFRGTSSEPRDVSFEFSSSSVTFTFAYSADSCGGSTTTVTMTHNTGTTIDYTSYGPTPSSPYGKQFKITGSYNQSNDSWSGMYHRYDCGTTTLTWNAPRYFAQPNIELTPANASIITGIGLSKIEKFVARNTGEANLQITNITQNGKSLGFIIQDDNCSGSVITPNASCSFNLSFSPSSKGIVNTNINILSNDPDNSTFTIPVTGEGIEPNLIPIYNLIMKSTPRVGCDGVLGSGKIIDECGICGGDNMSCAGCDGVPNSGLTFDRCGVCGGDGSTCPQCSLTCTSTSYTYSCGTSSSQQIRYYCYIGSTRYTQSLLVTYTNGHSVNCVSSYCGGPFTCSDDTGESCMIH